MKNLLFVLLILLPIAFAQYTCTTYGYTACSTAYGDGYGYTKIAGEVYKCCGSSPNFYVTKQATCPSVWGWTSSCGGPSGCQGTCSESWCTSNCQNTTNSCNSDCDGNTNVVGCVCQSIGAGSGSSNPSTCDYTKCKDSWAHGIYNVKYFDDWYHCHGLYGDNNKYYWVSQDQTGPTHCNTAITPSKINPSYTSCTSCISGISLLGSSNLGGECWNNSNNQVSCREYNPSCGAWISDYYYSGGRNAYRGDSWIHLNSTYVNEFSDDVFITISDDQEPAGCKQMAKTSPSAPIPPQEDCDYCLCWTGGECWKRFGMTHCESYYEGIIPWQCGGSEGKRGQRGALKPGRKVRGSA